MPITSDLDLLKKFTRAAKEGKKITMPSYYGGSEFTGPQMSRLYSIITSPENFPLEIAQAIKPFGQFLQGHLPSHDEPVEKDIAQQQAIQQLGNKGFGGGNQKYFDTLQSLLDEATAAAAPAPAPEPAPVPETPTLFDLNVGIPGIPGSNIPINFGAADQMPGTIAETTGQPGAGGTPAALAQPAETAGGAAAEQGGMFNLPTLTKDVYPKSYAGLDFNNPEVRSILSELTTQLKELPEVIGNIGNTLTGQYQNLMRGYLAPVMQQQINQLTSRNMLNSSVARDAMAGAMANVAQDIGNKAYQSMLSQLMARIGLPETLANISQIGRISTSGNPLAPYDLLSRLLT